MAIILKNITQNFEYDRKCYLLSYQLNDSIMKLDYCLEHYFKMEHLFKQSIELIEKAKEVAEAKGFETIQLYLPKNILADEVLFYKENGFEFYPKSSVKMYYKLTIKTNKYELHSNF